MCPASPDSCRVDFVSALCCPSHSFLGRNTEWEMPFLCFWPRHRFRLGWDNGSWSGQRSLQFAWGLDAHSSLVQAGQFLRLGSRAHPLYIILAFSKVGSCCTNFWRLLGDQRGFAWMNIPDWEDKSSEMTSEDYRFWEWRKTLIVSVCGIFPLFWLLLIVILLEHDVGRHLSDSRADRWERESEDK